MAPLDRFPAPGVRAILDELRTTVASAASAETGI